MDFKSVEQMAAALRKVSEAGGKAQRQAVQNAAQVVQRATTASMMSATHGDRNLHNVKKSNLKVTFKMSGTDANPSALVKAVGGAYAILDNPSRAHWIGGGRSTKRLKGGAQGPARPGKLAGRRIPIKVAGRWVMGPVLHPGTKGKHTFVTAAEASQTLVVKELHRSTVAAITAVFK